MGFNYANLRDNVADKLLKQFGRTLKVYRRVEGAYDAATGLAAVTESTLTFYGVVIDYETKQLDGETIKRGDKRVLLSAAFQTKEPMVGDEISIDNARHRIVLTNPVRPSDVTVMHDCTVRRA